MASPASGPNKKKVIVDPPSKKRGGEMKIQPIAPNRDDQLIRKMPITATQLKQIKKYYGIK